jgi:nicotinamide phosphoribosyltransferase
MNNIILMTDSYKISHWKQYPPGTEVVYSYFESRGCVVPQWTECTFFGLQYFLKEYMVGQVVTQEKIEEAFDVCQHHFGAEFVAPGLTNPGNFYREGWEYVLKNHGGRLPVKIKAVPEGMSVPTKTVLMTVENTDNKCYWLTNYLETLLVQVWYPMTVCSQSREQKKTIMEYFRKTGCALGAPPAGVCFSLNDFGFRGVSSVESAMTGGCGHLVNFIGSDSLAAMMMAKKYYSANAGSFFESPSFSIPASEHSTITSWGKEGELDAMRNMLTQYPEGLVACVSDSFDIWNACENYWGKELKSLIEKRPPPAGRLVVRPDSGEPTEVVPKICEILLEKFGSTTTSTGHKLLPTYIRVIQGDGVDFESIPKILQAMMDKGIAADNVAFGSGGALLQKVHRDTFKCAFKCSEIVVNGTASPVFKDPITDPGKASKKGRLTLQKAKDTTIPESEKYVSSKDSNTPGGKGAYHQYGDYVTVAEGKGDANKDLLVEVFNNGALMKDWTFDEVRLRADLPEGPFVSLKKP